MILLLLLLFSCSLGGPAPEAEPEAAPEPREVTLTPEALAAANLTIAPAEARAPMSSTRATARIQLDPRREAKLGPTAAGQVTRILVQPGDVVTAGQALATVRSNDVGDALGAWYAARGRQVAAAARLERLRGLETAGVSSRAEVLDAEAAAAEAEGALLAAKERLDVLGVRPTDAKDEHAVLAVRSPIAGQVLAADVAVGQSVAPGDVLFHVGDLDELWLLLDVPEREVAAVFEGQPVRFTVEALAGPPLVGTVANVGALVEEGSRTVEVRVVVPNEGHRLKPGMFAHAELAGASPEGPPRVVLPGDAVQVVDGRSVVFVEAEPGHFLVREVSVTTTPGGEAQVESGVTAGERVVTAGAFTLRSELAKGELGEEE